MISWSRSTSKSASQKPRRPWLPRALALAVGGGLGACASDDETMQDVLHGTIAYPFVDEGKAIGIEPPDDKFVIRSAVGGAEYQIQIPGGARDFDVQMPLAELDGGHGGGGGGGRPRDLANPVATDKEVVAALPQLSRERASDSALIDSAFGTAASGGPKQPPSYTLGMARINEYYKRRQFEYALVEINSLLAFFANSPQLHKMKGTVLLKMRNLALAELAWIKALQLSPGDRALQRALERLQKRIATQGAAKNITGPQQTYPVPKPLGTTPPKVEDALVP